MRKNVKLFASVLLIASMLFSFAGCARVKAYDKKEIKSILKDELSLKSDDYYTYEGSDAYVFSGSYGKAYFVIRIYDDEDDANDAFDDLLDDLKDDKKDDCFDGRIKFVSSKTSGYVAFNGEATDDGDFFVDDEYYYGGIYYSGDMIIFVYAEKDKDTAREDVNEFLHAFRLPRP